MRHPVGEEDSGGQWSTARTGKLLLFRLLLAAPLFILCGPRLDASLSSSSNLSCLARRDPVLARAPHRPRAPPSLLSLSPSPFRSLSLSEAGRSEVFTVLSTTTSPPSTPPPLVKGVTPPPLPPFTPSPTLILAPQSPLWEPLETHWKV